MSGNDFETIATVLAEDIQSKARLIDYYKDKLAASEKEAGSLRVVNADLVQKLVDYKDANARLTARIQDDQAERQPHGAQMESCHE